MEKAQVSIQRATAYESGSIRLALMKNLSLLGGLDHVFKPGSKVFVKINHLSPPSPPETAIVTHPAFTKEMLCILKDFGCHVVVGDDIHSKKKDGFALSGYRQICEETDIPLINLKEKGFKEVLCNGQILKKTYISSQVLDADCVVNLPKLKTHSFTVFTGAVKNMYGIIPHGLRLSYHRQYSDYEAFSRMLVDIYSCAPPRLNIMDAVIGMEGEGPSAGSPKNVDLILASTDAVALDAVATELIGLNPGKVFTTENAAERGFGIGQLDQIKVLGHNIRDVRVKDFKPSSVAVGLVRRRIPAFLHASIQGQLVLTPHIIREKCTLCEECINICPTGAARVNEGKARIEKPLCIHCMCCHEVCRFQAIKLKPKPLGRLIREVSSLYKKMAAFFS